MSQFQCSKQLFEFLVHDQNISLDLTIIGGLLSSHLLAEDASRLFSGPRKYNGELLRLATDLADRMLPAFKTNTGIPYSRVLKSLEASFFQTWQVNFRRGVLPDESPETCTAGAGTLTLEWITLSRLTGNPIYEVLRIVILNLC
jgi:hypothetical protein